MVFALPRVQVREREREREVNSILYSIKLVFNIELCLSSAFISFNSMKDNRELLAHGALLQCSSLLVSLGGAVAEGNKEEGLELVRELTALVFVFVACSVFKFYRQLMPTIIF